MSHCCLSHPRRKRKALSIPDIDASCLATVANASTLRTYLPFEWSIGWSLVRVRSTSNTLAQAHMLPSPKPACSVKCRHAVSFASQRGS